MPMGTPPQPATRRARVAGEGGSISPPPSSGLVRPTGNTDGHRVSPRRSRLSQRAEACRHSPPLVPSSPRIARTERAGPASA
jgi:hypothetical protein